MTQSTRVEGSATLRDNRRPSILANQEMHTYLPPTVKGYLRRRVQCTVI